MKQSLKMCLFLLLVSANLCFAAIASKSKDLVILEPQDLPQTARLTGQWMTLHQLNDGRKLLYVQQQQLGQLSILDVTDPAGIKSVGVAKLDLPANLESIAQLGDMATLVAFRGRDGFAVINFKNPAQPTLSPVAVLPQDTALDLLGFVALPFPIGTSPDSTFRGSDRAIIDTSNPGAPQVLVNVEKVSMEIVDDDTGATYLLGAKGLTVIRRPKVELEHWLWDRSTT